ncbi:MAG: hypothetical protein JRI95_11690 [Deltaproteobacteria bacterium]|nr:hypothetical protein [Deltaproteobacteria bacterium]
MFKKELSETFGISHSSVPEHINQLVRKGYLKREGRKARGLTVAKRPIRDSIIQVAGLYTNLQNHGIPVCIPCSPWIEMRKIVELFEITQNIRHYLTSH